MHAMNYTFQFGVILDRLPELRWASLLRLELAFAGFWLGLPIALMLAAMRTSYNFLRWQRVMMVIMPQSWPVILPPAMVFMVAFIKDTALVGQIGVFEPAFRGRELNNQGCSGMLVFATIACLYFVMSYPLARLGQWLEKRLAAPRRQGPERQLR